MATFASGAHRRLIVLALSTALGSTLAVPAKADSPHPNRDGNGVDLTTGDFTLSLPIASIGSGQAELPLIAQDGQTDNWTQTIAIRTPVGANYAVQVRLGSFYDEFTVSAGGTAISSRGTGATPDVGRQWYVLSHAGRDGNRI